MAICKKIIFPGVITINLFLIISSEAAIKGSCSVCHSMHNSEQGSPVSFSRDSSGQMVLQDQPFANLLKTDCLGCHSHTGAETIINMGETDTPIVLNLSQPTYPPDGSSASTLAGGNFHWVKNGDSYGHNVYGIIGQDSRLPPTMVPGAKVRPEGCSDCHGSLATEQSGCKGCHLPFHHSNSEDAFASMESGWFRFLGSVMQRDDQDGPPPEGVIGVEATDWEQNPLADQHNTYQGTSADYINYLETGSISQKCVGCHSRFHNETVANSTWIRHPSDAVIPNSGEFSNFSTYNTLTPVARQNVSSEDAGFSSINLGSDLVSCISCHRAHGSPYPGMLRWGYRDWPGEDSHRIGLSAQNGCAVCHTLKD